MEIYSENIYIYENAHCRGNIITATQKKTGFSEASRGGANSTNSELPASGVTFQNECIEVGEHSKLVIPGQINLTPFKTYFATETETERTFFMDGICMPFSYSSPDAESEIFNCAKQESQVFQSADCSGASLNVIQWKNTRCISISIPWYYWLTGVLFIITVTFASISVYLYKRYRAKKLELEAVSKWTSVKTGSNFNLLDTRTLSRINSRADIHSSLDRVNSIDSEGKEGSKSANNLYSPDVSAAHRLLTKHNSKLDFEFRI